MVMPSPVCWAVVAMIDIDTNVVRALAEGRERWAIPRRDRAGRIVW
jgi:hypothetical protein